MKFAFAILKLRPLGGKERDFIGLVREFHRRGHAVQIIVSEPPTIAFDPAIQVTVLPVSALTNHGRHRAFAEAIRKMRHAMAEETVVVGFDRVSAADYLFVTTRPHAPRPPWKRRLPRHRALIGLEQEAFGPDGSCFAFFLTQDQAERYASRYGITSDRYAVLPLTFGVGRSLPATYYDTRKDIRRQFAIADEAPLLIHVAVNGWLKGLDRAIDLLPELARAHLLVVGETGTRFQRQARRRGVAARVHFAGYVDDLPRLLCAADLLVHPAREENTGTVILESLLYGVPAVVSAECGYAEHVLRCSAGSVVPSPFDQASLLTLVRSALAPEHLEELKAAARRFGPQLVSEGGIEAVAEVMLATIARRHSSRTHQLRGPHHPVR